MSLQVNQLIGFGAGSGGPLWTPDLLGSLILWLDAYADATITTANGAVGSWVDKSATADTFSQGTAGSKPTHSTTTHRVTFDGGDFVRGTHSFTLKPVTIIAVVRRAATGAVHTILDGVNINTLQLRIGSGNKIELIQEQTAAIGASSTSIGTSEVLVGATFGSAGAYAFYLNGTADGSGTNNLGIGAAAIDIGQQSASSTERFNGTMAEVLVFNVVLSTDERQKTEGYIAWHCGDQGLLPGGHPYASAAPTV